VTAAPSALCRPPFPAAPVRRAGGPVLGGTECARGTAMDQRKGGAGRFFGFLCLCMLVPASILGACGSESERPGGPQGAAAKGQVGELRRKAIDHDLWLETWHLPAYGSHLHVTFKKDTGRTQVDYYHGHGDSCIWTGTYVAGQAFRYKATGDPQARANVIRSVGALSRHLHVTGRKGFIARYVGPASEPGHRYEVQSCTEKNDCHLVSSGPYAGDFWKGNTSRDQYTGWFLGMAMAYDLVDDEAMRSQIAADVAEVLDRLIQDRWWIVDVDGIWTTKAPNVLPSQQMTWSLIGYHLTGEQRFLDVFAHWAHPGKRKQLRVGDIALFNRYAQHYGLNLAHENYFNLLRLSRRYADPETHAFLVDLFTSQIHSVVDLQHNPWYTAIYLAEGEVQDREVFLKHRDQLIEDLKDFRPAPKSQYAMTPPEAELDPLSVFLYNLQQELPWLKDLMGTVSIQAAEAYPVRYQCFSDFIFQRNMWAISCGDVEDNPDYVASGNDYLAPYWLAAAYGILDESL